VGELPGGAGDAVTDPVNPINPDCRSTPFLIFHSARQIALTIAVSI
jgi:hypothetical protein